MEQLSEATQIIRAEEYNYTHKYRWMRHFFSEDRSPDNHPLIELQRRAAWIAVALIFQAFNEIDRSWYIPFVPWFKQYSAIIPFVLILGSIVAMIQAFRPLSLQRQAQDVHNRPRRWQRVVLIFTLVASIAGCIQLGHTIWMSFLPPQYTNDGTTLDTNAAFLLLQGRNPYADSNLVDIARHYPIQPNWTTPLRIGQFAGAIVYPNSVELRNVLDTDLKAGKTPEFESKVSYPALSFLTLVPFVWLNFFNVLPFYFGSYLLIVYIAWKYTRPELRPWVLLLSLANVSMWSSVLGGNLDIFYALLILVAWLSRHKTWTSSLFLGLALASKQPAWFFVPFYAILVFRTYGLKEVVRRMVIAGAVALAINLPFILWNSSAWLSGILAPIADPMFPLGVGIVGLAATNLVPYYPSFVYNSLEALAMVAALLWYWRLCKEYPAAAMLLAILPLFFAWRSLPSYFYNSAFPLFIIMAAKPLDQLGYKPIKTLKAGLRTLFESKPLVGVSLRTPTSAHAAVQQTYSLRNITFAPQFMSTSLAHKSHPL